MIPERSGLLTRSAAENLKQKPPAGLSHSTERTAYSLAK